MVFEAVGVPGIIDDRLNTTAGLTLSNGEPCAGSSVRWAPIAVWNRLWRLTFRPSAASWPPDSDG
ncbi:hypothetical protein MAHJHV54_49350 [Mycobacterium avium subsp. hominissuis]